MRRFSPRLFALGFALSAVVTTAVLAAAGNASTRAATRPADSTPTASTQNPDQVIQWNRILLGILRTPGAQPATVHPTRSMAIMHAAVYDAVNAIVKTHAEYLVQLKAPRHASVSAAAAQAAHDVLVQLYPSQTVMLDADLATSLASVADGPAKDQGVSVGAAAAAQILARQRRLGRDSDSVHAGNESGRLPAHAAGVRAAGLHALAVRHALCAPACKPVQAGTAAVAHEPGVRRSVQRGQEPR
jgi:hypothetical protein